MAGNLQYRVLPEDIPDPPAFEVKVPHWGCPMAIGAFIVGVIVSQLLGSEPAGSLIVISLVIGAVAFASFQHNEAKKQQTEKQESQWVSQQIAEREGKARDLTLQASSLMNGCQGSLGSFPETLTATNNFLNKAEADFLDKAYAPFWDNIEQAALSLGTFNSRLKQIELDYKRYNQLLHGRVHNFPPLVLDTSRIPVPVAQTERFLKLVRQAQRDFEFASIWEHRKTQKIMLEGFRTLGDAVNNLGVTVEDSAARVSKSIEESSNKIREEQKQFRMSFEDAVNRWEERKRLYRA